MTNTPLFSALKLSEFDPIYGDNYSKPMTKA